MAAPPSNGVFFAFLKNASRLTCSSRLDQIRAVANAAAVLRLVFNDALDGLDRETDVPCIENMPRRSGKSVACAIVAASLAVARHSTIAIVSSSSRVAREMARRVVTAAQQLGARTVCSKIGRRFRIGIGRDDSVVICLSEAAYATGMHQRGPVQVAPIVLFDDCHRLSRIMGASRFAQDEWAVRTPRGGDDPDE